MPSEFVMPTAMLKRPVSTLFTVTVARVGFPDESGSENTISWLRSTWVMVRQKCRGVMAVRAPARPPIVAASLLSNCPSSMTWGDRAMMAPIRARAIASIDWFIDGSVTRFPPQPARTAARTIRAAERIRPRLMILLTDPAPGPGSDAMQEAGGGPWLQ